MNSVCSVPESSLLHFLGRIKVPEVSAVLDTLSALPWKPRTAGMSEYLNLGHRVSVTKLQPYLFS